jgi:hypothetical protein
MQRELPEFTKEARSVPFGSIWEHYTKKRYLIIAIARHSETLEELVVYQALYGNKDVWVRPLKMFLERVEIEGASTERFTCV